MKYITFVNGKGGVGKTTLTVGCALALHHLKKQVRIIDCDKQQTATEWWQQVAPDQPQNDSDIAFVDTPPDFDSAAWIKAVHQATHLFLVTSPSPADLKTSSATIRRIRDMVQTPLYLIFNQVEKGTILSNNIDEFAESLGVSALESKLHRKQEYQHSVMQGWSSLSKSGKIELQSIVMEILTLAIK